MRWIKHPSAFCRSAAMSEVREALGPAGYGAAWLLLERIAESWSGKDEPELCLSEKEWRNSCGISVKKLHELLEIMKNHEIIAVESINSRLLLKAPILLSLQDEWTSRQRKNSGAAPDSLESDSGIQQIREREEKNRNKHGMQSARASLYSVLLRHGIQADSERGRRLVYHIEQKQPNNPGGYLEKILQTNPGFDPQGEPGSANIANNRQGPRPIGEALSSLGLPYPQHQ